jgi:hypothetical protein
MYPASVWCDCSGPSWISTRARSLYRLDLIGPVGPPVFDRAGKTGLHRISASRRPRRVFRSLYHRFLFSFLLFDCGLSLVPTHVSPGQSRAGLVKAGRRAGASTITPFPGHALAGPSTVPNSAGNPTSSPPRPDHRLGDRIECIVAGAISQAGGQLAGFCGKTGYSAILWFAMRPWRLLPP